VCGSGDGAIGGGAWWNGVWRVEVVAGDACMVWRWKFMWRKAGHVHGTFGEGAWIEGKFDSIMGGKHFVIGLH
jgi:hypothetical protein